MEKPLTLLVLKSARKRNKKRQAPFLSSIVMNNIKRFARIHPNIVAWAAMAFGMVIILLVMSRGVYLLPGQMAVLIVSTMLLAGASVWIISWESDSHTPNNS
ncbi:MAG: hypothetical protein EXR50_02060 [Dehalococcoidia bacterium]|nr:hypothetical protein [Dehalococcoidia bacterium]